MRKANDKTRLKMMKEMTEEYKRIDREKRIVLKFYAEVLEDNGYDVKRRKCLE